MRTLFACLLLSLAASAADSAGGVHWKAPAAWKSMPDRPMRAATYRVPAATGDAEDGECGIYFFGPGQGGSVEANQTRWLGQFDNPTNSKTEKRTIRGLRVTMLGVSGTYTGAGGPMATTKSAKPGYRLLGAIVEAPQGNVFFKFTGPSKTVEASAAAFETMVASVSP